MIVKLKNQKVSIEPMIIPEPSNHVYIEYEFEFNTNHLTPRIIIEGLTLFIGDKRYISLVHLIGNNSLKVIVELVDAQGVVLHTYEGRIENSTYSVLGAKPIRPDIDAYVKYLEKRVKELEEQGEVV